MIKILVSDDNRKLFAPWAETAISLDIDLVCFSNWEEARFELDNSWEDYEFIILDGKGKIQENGVEANSKHLVAAIQWLKEQLGNGRYKPVVIYTGYYEAIEEIAIKDGQILEIFDKDKQEIDEVLNFILREVGKTPENVVRAQFPDIFEIFDLGLLSREMKTEFVEIISEIKKNNPSDYKSTLRRMRPVIESVLIKLNSADEHMIPKGLFKRGVPEISAIIHHLAGKPRYNKEKGEQEYYAEKILPEHVHTSIDSLYDIASKVAMHQYEKDITVYVVKSCLFALLEFLIWFKTFYTKNYTR